MAGVDYLHGSEILPVQKGKRNIQIINASVHGLIGIAPRGPRQQLVEVLSDTAVADFGLEVPGFTIPQALAAIYANQRTAVLVINVFDETAHTIAVTLEALVVANGVGRLGFPPVQAGYGATVALYTTNGGSPTAFAGVYGTDYTIDDYGNIKALTSTLADATYYATYKKLVAGNVTTNNIIGTFTSGVRTGMKLWEEAYVKYGYKPKILLAPGYSSTNAIRIAMELQGDKYKAVVLIDAPASTTVANAILGRGPSGAINFYTANQKTILLYPMVMAYDAYTGEAQARPYSQFYGGVMAATDKAEGYHVSPSSHTIKGISGLERNITYDPGDSDGTTEANQLNKVGIVTVANTQSKGFIVFGNRNASWPGSSDQETFIPILRTRYVVEDSVQYGMSDFLDKPVTAAYVDNVIQTVQTLINTLIGRDALLPGSNIAFDPNLNTGSTLTMGQVIWTIDLGGPVPAERLTFFTSVDPAILEAYLKQIIASQSGN